MEVIVELFYIEVVEVLQWSPYLIEELAKVIVEVDGVFDRGLCT